VNGAIVYDYYLKHFIQIVSQDNYFMNYGLWDNENQDLYSANKNLANLMFQKAAITSNVKILDVGCGYGEQDIIWTNEMTANEMTKNQPTDDDSHITAVDISETQILEAIERRNQRGISDKHLSFEVCDAMKLDKQYAPGQFDVVFSLESAFHYADRPKFFANVNSVLQKDGVFVISDILLDKDYKQSIINDLFLKIYSDFLHIPKQNLIGQDEWKQQLIDAGFEIIEYNDITSQTFGPYYKHFMHTYFKNKNLPTWMADVADNLFHTIQPFSYSVCKLKRRTV
jgi:cyclopropane fatty-acyl-phospholipid synthase-like methyltransferase